MKHKKGYFHINILMTEQIPLPLEPTGVIDNLPAWEEIFRVAPMTTIVVALVLVGVGIAWFLMKGHLKDMRDIIEYFKNRNQ